MPPHKLFEKSAVRRSKLVVLRLLARNSLSGESQAAWDRGAHSMAAQTPFPGRVRVPDRLVRKECLTGNDPAEKACGFIADLLPRQLAIVPVSNEPNDVFYVGVL